MVQQRYILVSIMSVVGAVTFALRISFPLLLTQMVYIPNNKVNNNTEDLGDGLVCPIKNLRPQNETEISHIESSHGNDRYKWSQELQGAIISSLFWGTVVSQIPGGILVQKYGPKIMLLTTLILASVTLAFSPLAVVHGGGIGLLITRIIIGILQGPLLPCLSSLSVTWFPIEERGRSSSIIQMGINAGGSLSTFFIGLIVNQTGRWDLAFYGFAAVTGIAGILFGLFCYDNPQKHPYISMNERIYLKSKTAAYLETEKRILPPTPWKAIILSIPVIALIFAQGLYQFAINVLIVASSKYLNDVLHISVEGNSIYNSVPRILNLFLALFVGFASDWMLVNRNISLTKVRIIFSVIAASLPAICIVATIYSGCNDTLAAIFLALATTGQGADVASFEVNAIDLAPNYIGPFRAYIFTLATAGNILAPYIAGILTLHSFLPEWHIVLWIMFVAYILSAVIFTIWGSAKVQPFNSPRITQKV